jgi:histidinol-phosphate/aromatic aminotransferase/cobyric acid decarboxylase-like protein
VPAPPPGLAVQTYRESDLPPNAVDLRWSPDEVEFVRSAIQRAWREIAGDGSSSLVERSRRFNVFDPYGAEAAAEPLSQHFGWPVAAEQITFGAGVSGLLHDLANLATTAPVCAARLGHPDLPTWATRLGARVECVDPWDDLDHAVDTIRRERPSLVVLESPDILGRLADLATVRALSSVAAETMVIVDEAQASYLGPAASVARLVEECENVVVLRGLSKGYCCGGLRVGYALASPAATRRVRLVVAGLGTSALAFDLALRLLAQADVFGALRGRIADVKPTATRLLREAGVPVGSHHADLPWVTAPSGPAIENLLRSRHIGAKYLNLGPPGAPRHSLVKLAVPLSSERHQRFLALLGGADGRP